MRLAPRIVAILLLGSGAASTAPAGELLLGFDSRLEWDDNVFRNDEDEEEDFSIRAGPILRARSENGDVQYDVEYRPIYEGFFRLDGISAWDHFVRAEGSWNITDATEVFASDFFSRTRSLSRIADVTTAGTILPEPELARERIARNDGEVGVRHAFSPRWVGEATAGARTFEFSRDTRFDSVTWQAEGNLSHQLTRRDQLGLGVGFIQVTFDDLPTQEGDTTDYYQAFGLWSHRFSPTWDLSLRAGPSLAESEESGESSVTVFGSGQMTKRWKTVTTALSYQRTASTVPGLGQATDVDAVQGRVTWRPSPKWSASFAGSWTREESSIDQELCFFSSFNFVVNDECGPLDLLLGGQNVESRDFDLRLWRVEARVERRISPSFRVFASAIYQDQDSDRDLISGGTRDFGWESFRAILGVRYELDALRF